MQLQKKRKVLISGAQGFLGSAVSKAFEDNSYDVFELSRKSGKTEGTREILQWNPEIGQIPDIEGFDAVVHLAGENIFGIWTKAKRARILESRVKGTRLISEALAKSKSKPSVFICASAIGYYGNNAECDESQHKGEGFLSDVCAAWEDATKDASRAGIRTVNLRFGAIISEKGGMLSKIAPFYKSGFGAYLGNGRNYISWISLVDAARAILFCANNTSLKFAVNAVSPNPLMSDKFYKTIADKYGKNVYIRIPRFLISFFGGEFARSVILSNQKIECAKLNGAGFQFENPELGDCF